jgi:hypothetical protein
VNNKGKRMQGGILAEVTSILTWVFVVVVISSWAGGSATSATRTRACPTEPCLCPEHNRASMHEMEHVDDFAL